MPRPILPRTILIPTGPSIAYVPLTQGLFALIDAEDAERVGQYKWNASKAKSTGAFYARSHAAIEGRRSSALHRFVLRLTEEFGDHRNGNTLDCRKVNIRPANRMQNGWNRKPDRDSRSGIKGAHWNGRDRNWVSYIRVGNVKYRLGSFATAELAGAAYKDASIRLHGEYSYFAREGSVTSKA